MQQGACAKPLSPWFEAYLMGNHTRKFLTLWWTSLHHIFISLSIFKAFVEIRRNKLWPSLRETSPTLWKTEQTATKIWPALIWSGKRRQPAFLWDELRTDFLGPPGARALGRGGSSRPLLPWHRSFTTDTGEAQGSRTCVWAPPRGRSTWQTGLKSPRSFSPVRTVNWKGLQPGGRTTSFYF